MNTTTTPHRHTRLSPSARTVQFNVSAAPSRAIQLNANSAPVSTLWSTPTRWWLMLAALLALVGMFMLTVNHAARDGKQAFERITRECAPSILAAQHIRTSLADFDADLDDQLIAAPGSPEMLRAVDTARARHEEFADAWLTAAANVTFGPSERKPLAVIANDLGTYEAGMARARALREKEDFTGALAAVREASHLMRDKILPAAGELDTMKGGILDRTYAAQQSRALAALFWVIVSGLLCLAALGGAQWRLWQSTRRRINPGLLLATLLTAVFFFQAASGLLQASYQLQATTRDAFDSMRYLWKARASAYEANAVQSRLLYDRGRTDTNEYEFTLKAAEVAKPPPGQGLSDVAMYALEHSARPAPEEFKGFLARELGNITYTGELAAAADAVQTYGAFLDVGGEVRRLDRSSHHDQAVSLWLSTRAGGNNPAFTEFDAALGKVLAINVEAFERYAKEGVQGLAEVQWMTPGFAALSALLIFGGFWPRIKEYAR